MMGYYYRYNVRKVDGTMKYGATESQKNTIVNSGGTVVNKIKHKVSTYSSIPKVDSPPLAPVSEPEPSTSPSDLLLQARVSGVESSIKDQLQLWAEGKITQEELVRRKTAIEEGHLDWYTGFEETGATETETKAIIQARGAESAARLESTIKQILTMEAEGEITHQQSVDTIKKYQKQQLEEVKGIISGEDVRAGESGLELGYVFKEQPVVSTVTKEVDEVPLEDPSKPSTDVGLDILDKSDPKVQAYLEYGRSRTASKLAEEQKAILKPVDKPIFDIPAIDESVDSRMFTHMGITMTREQFEADFPSDTIPDGLMPSLDAKMPSLFDFKSKLPDPNDFVGIPGPASKPREGSIREKIQDPLDDWLQNIEDVAVGFRTGMEMAGRELGAEAQEAFFEEDYAKALITGTVAATTRFGTGIYDAASFIVRPLAWGKMGEALVLGAKDVVEHPEDVPGGIQKWVEHIAHDPGSIVQFAGDIATGLAFDLAIKTIAGPTNVLTRLDDIDINVKSTTLKLVDEVDPIKGTKVKVPQFPEAELKSTISKRKIPKTVSKIMDVELGDLSGKGQILGMADEAGLTILDKIDLPEGALDDLLEGKKVQIKGVLDVETVKVGSETFRYVDEIADPFTGTKTKISRTGKATPFDAKEIGVTMEIAEDASRLSKLALEGDELVTRPPPDIDIDTVKFKSVWDDKGRIGILEEGQHSYEVKGMVTETTPLFDDLIDDIKPIEPTTGRKTPIGKHFQQPGYTGSLKDISDSLAKELVIAKEITEGVIPTAKLITETAKASPVLAAGLGVGAALSSDPFTEEMTMPIMEKSLKGDALHLVVAPTKLPSPIEDTKLILGTLDEGLGVVDAPIQIIGQDPIQDLIPVITPVQKITQDPFQDIKPVITPIQDIIQDPFPIIKPVIKPIPDIIQEPIPIVTPIEDIIQEPIPIVTPIEDIIQEPILAVPLMPPQFRGPRYPPHPYLPHRPKKRRRRKKRVGPPPLGYELKEYKLPRLGESKTKGKKGRSKTKKKKLPPLNIPSTKLKMGKTMKTKKSKMRLPKL